MAPTTIREYGGPDQKVYIWQDGSDFYYRYNDSTHTQITDFPIIVENSNTDNVPLNYLHIIFESNMTFTAVNQHFICNTDRLYFTGNHKVITISNAVTSDIAYPGLIKNGSDTDDGKSLIRVEYIAINSVGAILSAGAGWICQEYFGKYAINNQVVGCSVDASAPIANSCGGIIGNNCGLHNTPSDEYLIIWECYTLGAIGFGSGGICGGTDGYIDIQRCYSAGDIDTNGGGILGANSSNNCNISIYNCYSEGDIGNAAGGIVGPGTGGIVDILNCYSTGDFGDGNTGGIVGPECSTDVIANHCYTSGTGATEIKGGIYADSDNDNLRGANNYSECNNGNSGTWSDANANSALTGYPPSGRLLGANWSQITDDTPYKLARIGLSPYTSEVADYFEETVIQTGTTTASILPTGYTYTILEVYADSDIIVPDFSGLVINASTGAITVSQTFPAGYYELIIQNSINPYDITRFNLTIDLICYGVGTQILVKNTAPADTGTTTNTTEATTADIYADISTLHTGILIKTLRYGYLPIESIGVKTIRTGEHPKTTLFRLPANTNGQDELVVTGGHSILLDAISRHPKKNISNLIQGHKTQKHKLDGCRRVLAMNWPGAKHMAAGVKTQIYHLVLSGPQKRYAIWVNGGWLSETTTREHLKQYRFTPVI